MMLEITKRPVPGPRSRELLDAGAQVEPGCAADQVPVVWDHAEGVWVTDVDGNRFLDFTSGVLVVNIGHSHPRAVEAVQRQAARLGNTYSFPTPERLELSRRVVDSLPDPLDRIFMLTTGAEATEAALRMARRYTGRHEVLAFTGAFHGRTYGAMAVAGMQGTKRGFGAMVPGTVTAPYPYCYRCPFKLNYPDCGMACIEALDTVVDTQSSGDLGTIIVEPYQGAAGFIFPPEGWLTALREWADDRDLVLIVDEVQASFGRTGRMYAIEWEGVTPDILCLGKGFGTILPVSAVVARHEIFEVMGAGELSSTWGGNPLASAGALAVLDVIEDEDLVANSEAVGIEMMQAFQDLQQRFPALGDVRGRGLVMGLEFVDAADGHTPAPDTARALLMLAAERGLLLGRLGIHGNVVRIAPPLTITVDEALHGVRIIEEALGAMAA